MSIEPGIHDHIEELAYHADAALSASGAKTLLHSPARFAWERAHGTKASDAMDFGTLVHALVLRSHDSRIVVNPYESMRTNAAKAWAEEMEAAGRIVVSPKDVRRAIAVAKAVHAHPLAGAILSEGRPEVTLRWDDEASGVECRSRIDWLRDNALIDLKKTVDASPAGFRNAVARYGYDVQAAWYQDGYRQITGKHLPFVFVCVEPEPPYLVAVYQLSPDWLERGYEKSLDARETFKRCRAVDEWPGYSEAIIELDPPRWAS